MDPILAVPSGAGRGLRLAAYLVLALVSGGTARAETPDALADRLLARLTLPEKLGLLHGFFATGEGRPKPPGAIGSAGFVPGVPRLGIPALQETDAGLGVTNPGDVRPGDTAAALPSGLAAAASFDADAAYQAGAALGRQAASRHFNVVLGGGVDLVRDPRGGRGFEYAGEDPLLAGVMAGAAVRGVQDQHVIATVKHFAANDQETGRMVLSADLPEAALRESDLLAFEIAIERGQPGAVMCAYNRVNGIYACENPDLLQSVLKGDWHYPGWVMSDWGAVHGVAALAAGLDQESGQELDSQTFFGASLAQAVASGAVPQARIDDAVHRILRSMAAAGLFDRHAIAVDDAPAGMAAARRVAAEGLVLLQNNGVVPLPKTLRSICVIGGQADAGVPAGGGSSQVTPAGGVARRIVHDVDVQPSWFAQQFFDPPSPLSRIAAKLLGARVLFDDGSNAARAASVAKSCDATVIFAADFSGEAVDRKTLKLPGAQDELIGAVLAANARSVVVLETSGAVTMPWLGRAGAVIEAWYSGSGGADAIADVLFGDTIPTGRLPVSFPASEADLPDPVLPGRAVAKGAAFTVHYREGPDVGYRWYSRHGIRPIFAFGHGLSTTRFVYSHLHVIGGTVWRVECDVRNAGMREGVDVPQLYWVRPDGGKRLLGWSRMRIGAGETRHVVLTAERRIMAGYDTARHEWVMPNGPITIGLGTDADTIMMTAQINAGGGITAP